MNTSKRHPLLIPAATGLALGLAIIGALGDPGSVAAVGTLSPGEVALQLHDRNHARTTLRIGSPMHLAVSFLDADGPQLPSGTVRIQYYAGGTCAGTPAKTTTASMVNGVADPGGDPYTPTFVGQMCTSWAYSGDALYEAQSGTITTAIQKALPSIELQVHNSTHQPKDVVPTSTSVHAYARVTGNAGVAAGQVTIVFFATGNCSGTGSSTIAQLSNGQVDGISQQAESAPAVRSYRADYGGSAVYAAGASPCIGITWKATPAIESVVHDPDHLTPEVMPTGGYVHLRIVVRGDHGTPTGSLEVKFFPNGTCTAPATTTGTKHLTGGVSDTTSAAGQGLAPPVASQQARYLGDGSYLPVLGPCVSYRLKGPSSITSAVVHDAAHQVVTEIALYGRVHVRAEVAGTFGTPTGSARTSLWENATCSGAPNVMTSWLLADGVTDSAGILAFSRLGQMSVRVDYLGSDIYFGTLGPCLPVTVKALPTIQIEAFDGVNPVTTLADGQAFRYRTRLLGAFGIVPTRPLTIHAYSEAACQGPATTAQVTVGGGAEWQQGPTMTSVGPGVISARATYAGDASYLDAESPCVEVTVTAAAPTAAPSQGSGAPTAAPTAAPTTPIAPDASGSPPGAGAPGQSSTPAAGATDDPGGQPSIPVDGQASAAPPSGPGETGLPPAASGIPFGTMAPAGPGGPVEPAAGSPGDGRGGPTMAGAAAGALLVLALMLLVARRRSGGLGPGQG